MATREDVQRLFGELDDLTIARILDTGASVDELEAAISQMERSLDQGERAPTENASSHTAELRSLLAEILIAEESSNEEAHAVIMEQARSRSRVQEFEAAPALDEARREGCSGTHRSMSSVPPPAPLRRLLVRRAGFPEP